MFNISKLCSVGAAKHNYSSWNELFSVHLRDSSHFNLSNKSGTNNRT